MGPLIVLEGIDGCGKTLQAEMLAQRLRARELPVLLTKQPTTRPIGRLIRQGSRSDRCDLGWAPSPRVLATLFAADRIDHYEHEVWPALSCDQIVVCDRYYHSSMCYQGTHLGPTGPREIRAMNAHVPAPDLVVVIDLPIDVALDRIAARTTREIYEDRYALTRTALVYADLERHCPGERIVRVDGTRSAQVVGDVILEQVEASLKGRAGI